MRKGASRRTRGGICCCLFLFGTDARVPHPSRYHRKGWESKSFPIVFFSKPPNKNGPQAKLAGRRINQQGSVTSYPPPAPRSYPEQSSPAASDSPQLEQPSRPSPPQRHRPCP